MTQITSIIRTTSAVASAPAKIILFGEHFVNYDNPSILAAINHRTKVTVQLNMTRSINIKSNMGLSGFYRQQSFDLLQNTAGEYITIGDDTIEENLRKKKFFEPVYRCVTHVLQNRRQPNLGIDIDLNSPIPTGIGLGSSASCCVATLGAVNALFSKANSKQWIYRNAKECEGLIHKNSSGADCCASTFGGLIYYTKKQGFKKIIPKNKFYFIIANTGTKHSTGDMVSSVKKFKRSNESEFKHTIAHAHDICNDAYLALLTGNETKLGKLMNQNHRLLQRIGVSNVQIDKLVEICTKHGAIGAKLTGAGGGGCIIALLTNKQDKNSRVISKIKSHGYDLINAEIDYDGLLAG